MAGPLLIGAEGVILTPNPEWYGASRPISEGLELALQLGHFPTSRTLIAVGTSVADDATRWCKLHGLREVDVVTMAPEDRHVTPEDAQWYTIERQRARGPLHLVLTSYATVFVRCKVSHQPVLLFGRRGSLGAAPPQKSWDEMHARIVRQREAMIEEST